MFKYQYFYSIKHINSSTFKQNSIDWWSSKISITKTKIVIAPFYNWILLLKYWRKSAMTLSYFTNGVWNSTIGPCKLHTIVIWLISWTVQFPIFNRKSLQSNCERVQAERRRRKKTAERKVFNFYVILKVFNWILLRENPQDWNISLL